MHHLDNQGHALVTSGFLLDKYLDAADMVVEKALPSLKKPNIQEWIQNDGFEQGEFTRFMREVQFLDSNLKKNSLHHIRLYEHPRSQRHMGSYGYMSDLSEGVPADGYYFFAFDATALYKEPAL